MKKLSKKHIIAGIISILMTIVGVLLGSHFFAKTQIKTEILTEDYKIELSVNPVDAIITTEDGNIEVKQYPTVESIDGGNVTCDSEECGQGHFIYAPTATYTEFKDYTLNKCWDTDNFPQGAKAQCWDLGDLFWQN